MRLAIALGILAPTLPAASKTEDINHGLVHENRKQRLLKLLQEEQASDRSASGKRINRHKKTHATDGATKRPGTLKNVLPFTTECDPASKGADVGVLGCGVGKYCMARNTTAGLRGICVDEPMQMDRLLQIPEDANSTDNNLTSPYTYPDTYPDTYAEVCDPNKPFYAQYADICDCTMFDVGADTGTINCDVQGNYCLTDNGCNNTCYVTSLAYTKYEDSHLAIAYCFDFTSPYTESLCIGYGETTNNCTISLDGTPCTSCYEVVLTETCVPPGCFNISIQCSIFDCENVGLGAGNSCFEGIYSPSLLACFGDHTVAPTSAGIEPPPLYVCDICGNGKEITAPDGVVSVPDQPERTCIQVESAAQKGEIDENQCGLLKQFTKPCGCGVATSDGASGGSVTSDGSVSSDGSVTSDGSASAPSPGPGPSPSTPTASKSGSGSVAPGLFSSKVTFSLVGLSMTVLGFLAS